MIDVKLHLYGGFRQLGASEIVLKMQENSTIGELREKLKKYVQYSKVEISEQIIKVSVFATDDSILTDSDPVSGHMPLAVLPPVCGG